MMLRMAKRKGKNKKSQISNLKSQKTPAPAVTAALVKGWGFKYLTAADCQGGEKLAFDLAAQMTRKKTLAQAWERGQLLRKLADFGAGNATKTEMEHELELAPGAIDELFSKDSEAAEAFNNARIATITSVRKQIVEQVQGGKLTPTALKQLETMLRREVAARGVDWEHITTEMMQDLFGVTRQCIYDWFTEKGLPRNSDKTYNLRAVIRWFKDYMIGQAAGKPAAKNTFQDEKTRRLKMENDRFLGNLLDRGSVLSGWAMRYKQLGQTLQRRIGDLASTLEGQKSETILAKLTEMVEQAMGQLIETPTELKLPAAAETVFGELLRVIGDEVKRMENLE